MKQDENGNFVANDGTRHTNSFNAYKHEDEAYREASKPWTKPADLNGKLAQIITLLVFFFMGIFLLGNKAYFLFFLNVVVGSATVAAVDWCVKRIPEWVRFLIMFAIIAAVIIIGNVMVKR